MPILYELFYKVNFNIDEFLLKYEIIIHDECISHFIKYGDIDEKCALYSRYYLYLKNLDRN